MLYLSTFPLTFDVVKIVRHFFFLGLVKGGQFVRTANEKEQESRCDLVNPQRLSLVKR